MTAEVTKAIVFEDRAAVFYSQWRGTDGAIGTQEVLEDLAYAVFDLYTGSAVLVTSGSLVIEDVVFDALQTDDIWDAHPDGYNFRHVMAGTAFPTASHVYVVEYKAETTDGFVIHIGTFQVTAAPVYS